MFANTLFKCVSWHEPDECQLLTSGTDRKVAYWDAMEGALIRELLASRSGSVNGLATTTDGSYFVTGGDDKLIKVHQGTLLPPGTSHGASLEVASTMQLRSIPYFSNMTHFFKLR